MNPSGFSLILGGGAARGLAHIGIIERLEESSLTPSLIVGTSIGALVGAFYACGYTSKEMHAIVMEVSLLKLVDIDFKHGGIKGKKILAFLEKYFEHKTFEDTKIPLKIISVNIDTGEKYVFTEGKIIDAIRASISIPGLFSPYKYASCRLVDGGIVSNLAIEEALPDLPVVAVSVQIHEGKHGKKREAKLFETGIFTNTYGILRKTIQLMMLQNEERSEEKCPNALVLKIGKNDIDYYNFSAHEALIEEGYALGEKIVPFLQQ